MKFSLILMLFTVKMCFSKHLSVLNNDYRFALENDDYRYIANDYNEVDSKEEDDDDETVLEFKGDFEESVAGELGVGADFKIRYNGSRLPGEPRRIHAEYKFSEYGQVYSQRLNEDDDSDVFTETVFVPYEAEKVIIWFRREDQYDSDYGQNYNFLITKPSIVFDKDFGETKHGALEAGGKFDVWYDSARLDGDKDITAQIKFSEDGDVSDKKLAAIPGATSYLEGELSIPDDASNVIMWFYHVELNGDKHYDSNESQNYHFDLAKGE